MGAAIPDTHPAILDINLSAIRHNYKTLKNFVSPSCAVAGMVKADAYGLGVRKIVESLVPEEVPLFFVATPDEALAVRAVTNTPVAVLGGLFGAPDLFVARNIIPVINTFEDLTVWRQAAGDRDKLLPVILHLETGMNRLALTEPEIEKTVASPDILEPLDIRLIMSHLACADEADHPLNRGQINKFKDLSAGLPAAPKSLAASASIQAFPDTYMDMVRPGIALYGSCPYDKPDLDIRPVVQARGRVMQVKTMSKQSSIGYNATYRAKNKERVATVALGYADGLFRALSNTGRVYIQGRACPIRGRVSMDYISVDIGDLDVRAGHYAEIIGPNQSLKALARDAETIDYEILTALGRRYYRQYKD